MEAAYRFSIFSANRIPCLCVFACDELYFSYNSLPLRNRSIVQKYWKYKFFLFLLYFEVWTHKCRRRYVQFYCFLYRTLCICWMLISLLCVIFVNFYNLYVHVYLETICVIAKFAIIYSLFGSNIYKKWQHHIYWRYLSTIPGFVYFILLTSS